MAVSDGIDSVSQPKRRFRLERFAFIGTASVITGAVAAIITGVQSGLSDALGVFFMALAITAFLMLGCYHLAGNMDWGELFTLEVPSGAEEKSFDWKLFLMQPLYFLVAVLSCFLIVGVAMVVRWALAGTEK